VCSGVSLEKLIVTQLVKKFAAFYETLRPITLFTTASHTNSVHIHPTCLVSVLLVTSVSPRQSFTFGFSD